MLAEYKSLFPIDLPMVVKFPKPGMMLVLPSLNLQHSGHSISSDMTTGYHFWSHYYYLNRNKSAHYKLEIIKIGPLINGTRSSSVINQDSIFPLGIMALTSGEINIRDMMPNIWEKKYPLNL